LFEVEIFVVQHTVPCHSQKSSCLQIENRAYFQDKRPLLSVFQVNVQRSKPIVSTIVHQRWDLVKAD
jgi:hypothetical protein